MRRIALIISLIIASTAISVAQESGEQSVISLNSDGSNTISTNNGRLSLTLNGTRFEFGKRREPSSQTAPLPQSSQQSSTKHRDRAYFGLFGVGSPSFNHFAAVEIGANTLVNADYSAYPTEEANALIFSNKKAVNCNINIGTANIPLNPRRTLVASIAFGFAMENYTLADNYTLEFRDGMMRPVAIDGEVKKSKLMASYFHVPVVLDWNIKRHFFISAGVNIDVLINSQLKYKFPKTKIEDTITLNPVQVGLTARVGWKRLYAYVNYSFLEMFKHGTGPNGNRLSAGAGVWF